MAVNGSKWLDMPRMAVNSWNSWKLLKIAEMPLNGCK